MPSGSAAHNPTRVERKQRTRDAIIDAAIDIVRAEGIESLSTVRLAKAAGITQPGFYVHFENVEDCLAATAELVVQRLRRAQSSARQRVLSRVETTADVGRVEIVTDAYRETLDTFLSEPRFSELFLAHRRDGSPLGRVMAREMETTRREVADDLWLVASRLGSSKRYRPQMNLLAEFILGLFFAAAESLVDGRSRELQVVLDTLTRATRALLLAELAHFGSSSTDAKEKKARRASGSQ